MRGPTTSADIKFSTLVMLDRIGKIHKNKSLPLATCFAQKLATSLFSAQPLRSLRLCGELLL
jgi:hypothetical protein